MTHHLMRGHASPVGRTFGTQPVEPIKNFVSIGRTQESLHGIKILRANRSAHLAFLCVTPSRVSPGHSLHFGLSAPPAASQASVPGVASETRNML